MKKENNTNTRSTLLTDANLKNLIYFLCDDGIPLYNFEFWKKIVLLLTSDFFSRNFHSCKFFHERVSCVKNGTYRQCDRTKYVFKVDDMDFWKKSKI